MQGVKVQRILRGLDQARDQRNENDTLRNSLLDREDHIHRLFVQLLSVKRIQDEVAAEAEKSNATLKEFEERVSYSHTTKTYPAAMYLANCDQRLPEDLRIPEGTTLGLEDTVQRLIGVRREAHDNGKTLPQPIDQFLQRAQTEIAKMVATSERWHVDGTELVRVLRPTFDILHDLAKYGSPGDCLEEYEKKLAELREQEKEVLQRQEDAVDRGNVLEAEDLYFARVTLQEAEMDVISNKYERLRDEERQVVQRALGGIKQIREKTASDVDVNVAAFQDRKRETKLDLDRLNEEHRKVHDGSDTSKKAFQDEVRRGDELLQQNAEQQQTYWNQLQDALNNLMTLSDQRRDEVDRRVRAFEREERRRMEVVHFDTFASARREVLEGIIGMCDAALEATGDIKKLAALGCQACEKYLRGLGREVLGIREKLHVECSEHFSDMYLNAGDLLYKAERRVDEVERKIEMFDMRQETAMDSFNPAAKGYALKKNELTELRDRYKKDINVLKQKCHVYIEAFKPTEKALHELGKPFVHPVERLKQRNRDRSSKVGEFHALMLQESYNNIQGGLNPKVVDTNVDYDRELSQLADERKVVQARLAANPGRVRKNPRQIGSTSLSLDDPLAPAAEKID